MDRYFMVLPRKFGKEGSLVDAGAELEKLETAATSYPL